MGENLHLPFNPLRQTIGSRIQVIVGLEAKPEFRRGAEVTAQPERGVCGDASFAMDDFIDAPGGDAQVLAQPGLAEPQRLHEFLQQYFLVPRLPPERFKFKVQS